MNDTRVKKIAGTAALLRVQLAMLCALAALFCLAGCRMSDALTEVIYDQTSLNIDYENESKYLINDSTAEIQDDSVPAQESNKRGRVTEEKQNIVVYSSDPNAPQFVAKKSVWSKDPDFVGIEASETVHFYKSDDPDATEQDIETEDASSRFEIRDLRSILAIRVPKLSPETSGGS